MPKKTTTYKTILASHCQTHPYTQIKYTLGNDKDLFFCYVRAPYDKLLHVKIAGQKDENFLTTLKQKTHHVSVLHRKTHKYLFTVSYLENVLHQIYSQQLLE